MPRWEPNAKERLESAALDLYSTRGYDETTISDIAHHAGVTSRTYFRYFPDKREVLFGNADEMRDRITGSLRASPSDLTPLDACLNAMKSCADMFQRKEHTYLRRRDEVIESSTELQERETRKLSALAEAVACELERRGTDPASGRLAADLATVVFAHASRLWMDGPDASFAPMIDRAATHVMELLSRAPGPSDALLNDRG